MQEQLIARALSSATDTRRFVQGEDTLASVCDVFESTFDNTAAVVVADENTFQAAGAQVSAYLGSRALQAAPPIILPAIPPLYADYTRVLELQAQLAQSNAIPVVVGSGTLNDLTKLASHRLGRPYMVVATAASMDGYTAFGAAITKDGFKQTMSCPAPTAVLADLDVLVHAPAQMNSTGYGDLLGKVTAGADWLLADALEIEPIQELPWRLVQGNLRAWTGKPGQVHVGDRAAIQDLFQGLILTGIAMQISASSRPASGIEHHFSHLWEMQALAHRHPPVPHGFKVGIGTLAGAALYERILARDLTALDIEARVQSWLSPAAVETEVRQMHDTPQLANNAVEETLAKYIDADGLRRRLTLLRERWSEIRSRLAAQLLPAAQLRDLLHAAGCPVRLKDIGLDRSQLRASYYSARTIRQRYTVLDLAYETGLQDECVDEIFSDSNFLR